MCWEIVTNFFRIKIDTVNRINKALIVCQIIEENIIESAKSNKLSSSRKAQISATTVTFHKKMMFGVNDVY